MSTMTHDQTASFRAYGNSDSIFARVATWNQRRKTIARVTRELNTYSDRQLADLGLSRGDIPDVARGRITR